MGSTGQVFVHSFHLNVGAGDAAIHLQLERRNPSSITLNVLRAVLVDGGPGIGYAVLKTAIANIEGDPKYELDPADGFTGGKLKFDSIVVTHWDDDHYDGLKRLLSIDFQEQGEPMMSDDNDDLATKLAALQSRYMKYSSDEQTPMTTLYAPYWNTGESNTIPAPESGHILMWAKQQRDPVVNEEGDADMENKDLPILNIRVRFKNYKRDLGDIWIQNVANICTSTGRDNKDDDTEGMLGRELFTNRWRSKADYVEIDSPKVLVQKPDGWSKDPESIGLYVIGADTDFVGIEPAVVHAAVGDVIDDTKKNTGVNTSSIMCVLARSTGEILSYFGGDANFQTENLIPAWLAKGWPGQPVPRVRVMKLSHHGASSSSPTGVIKALNPKNIIVSCGQEYGHPSEYLRLRL
jgi:hypothetical protein